MKQTSALKIDAYSHIVPPKYKEVLYEIAPEQHDHKVVPHPALYDLEYRFRIMDKYEPIRQVLTLAWPPLEEVANPVKAAELAKIANDGMAELVFKYPERFVAAIAILPMNNVDAALEEADRAIKDLRFRGVYVYTPVDNKPLDLPEFMPLYEKMAQYDLPIFIHPMRSPNCPDYLTEKECKYGAYITNAFGWPYETTLAMTHLVLSGVMEKYPNLKVVTHHAGGMVPFFAERIATLAYGTERRDAMRKPEQREFTQAGEFTKAIIDYYKMFYVDTALYGNPAAIMCAHDFFGADHILFGADFPLGDPEKGQRNIRKTIEAIEQMNISDAERKKIFEDNARSLMRLPT